MTHAVPARESANLGLNQRRAVILRWWLILAVAVAVLSAPTALGIVLPQLPMLAVVLLLAAFNAYMQWFVPSTGPVAAGDFCGQLCVDLVAMAILLYLSGGAANPLISFLLVPVAVAALSLPAGLTAAIALLAIALYSLLMWQYLPLSLNDVEQAARLHLAGMWLTFVVSAIMIAWFVARMTASIRERDSRLAAAREQALRDERVVALGAMAAGAAHELGTPLATMAVVIGELERDDGLDAAAREDLALVRQQIAVCKNIISGLAASSGSSRPEQLRAQDAVFWLQAVLARWQVLRPHAGSRLTVATAGEAPRLATEPTLEQALVNLLNNAADAGGAGIEIMLSWDETLLTILIDDGGPGFDAQILREAGRVPLPASSGGGGIGLLLAFAAVERWGGRIVLENRDHGGRARVELPLLGKTAAK